MNATADGPTPSLRRHHRCWLALLLVAAAAPAAAEPAADLGPPVRLRDVRSGTLLLRTDHPGLFLPAPTVETEVGIRVTGFVARTRVRQRFRNPTADWVEGIYAFPLPETAAVDTLEMVVGDRVIAGVVQEREEAKRTYEAAKQEGRKASLVEQERPNLFTTSIANLGPDEEVDVTIEYQEELRYEDGLFRLRFPMVVAPRYVPGTTLIAGVEGAGRAKATAQVPDAPRITPWVAPPGAGPRHAVRLSAELSLGLPLARLESPSHPIVVEERPGRRYAVTLAAGSVPADADFVLEWGPQLLAAPQAALLTEERDGEHYALLVVVPPAEASLAAPRDQLAREVVFIIDTSGSMAGESIAQAREALLLALDRLGPDDLFNVIQFNSAADALFAEAVPAHPEVVAAARRYVAGLQADGGTEILPAVALALDDQKDTGRVRQVIFITDGCVGNEDEVFQEIRRSLGPSRLFTVGIGSAPNSHFMRRAAAFGRGTFTHVGSTAEVATRMGELFAKLEHPVVSGIEVVWDDPGAEPWPPVLPDLYLGEPVVVAARLVNPGGARVSGALGAAPWTVTLSGEVGAPHAGIEKLWARRKIGAIADSVIEGAESDAVRRAIVEVALAHHLVSQHTSLVAVDVTPTAPAGVRPQARPIALALPQGWDHEAVFGALPQTATPARLYLTIALALLIMAAVLGWAIRDGVAYRAGGEAARRGQPPLAAAPGRWS